MEQNKFLNESPEQVVVIPYPRTIRITGVQPEKAYGLFDSETGTQVSDFKKGTDGQVEFQGLDPSKHYDVGAIEGMGDDKPKFRINWTKPMRDDTDTILNNSGNMPVAYPSTYTIKDSSSNNVFDIVDNKGDKLGEVEKLAPIGDKPEICFIRSLKVKDDTKK